MTITHKLTPAAFTYDMGGVPLKSTDSHTYLGVLLNSKLNWNQQNNNQSQQDSWFASQKFSSLQYLS